MEYPLRTSYTDMLSVALGHLAKAEPFAFEDVPYTLEGWVPFDPYHPDLGPEAVASEQHRQFEMDTGRFGAAYVVLSYGHLVCWHELETGLWYVDSSDQGRVHSRWRRLVCGHLNLPVPPEPEYTGRVVDIAWKDRT